MKLPKELTTITPFSKFLALALFLVLPFVGFQLGMQYQQVVDSAKESQIINVIQPTPTPTISILPTTDPSTNTGWKIYKNDEYKISFQYPPNLIELYPSSSGDSKMLYKTFQSQDGDVTLEVAIAFAMKDLVVGRGAEGSKSILNESIKIDSYEGKLHGYETDPASSFWNQTGTKNIEDISIRQNYSIVLKNKPLVIFYGGSKERVSLKEFKEILSTFKFTQ